MSGPKHLEFDTLTLHGGQQPDPSTGSRAVPIYQSVAFSFNDEDEASSRFDIARSGYAYSRIANPTVAVLEERLAMLDGGIGAVATASGMAAIHLAIVTLASAGSHIVASKSLYGGTHNLLSYTLPRFGITTSFVDTRDPDAFAQAIKPNTTMFFTETVSNPDCAVADIPRLAAVAHQLGLPLVVDATLTTPYLMRPLEHGADIVVHSLTKFIGGHGTTIGGVVIDGGTFEWLSFADKFPTLCQPYDGFDGLNFAEEFGPSAFIIRARREGLRDFGACLSATSAFQLLQGVETLSLRMERHVANTEAVVNFLDEQDSVEQVFHPSLEGHRDYALAKELYPKGMGAVMSFEIKGGYEAAKRFINGLHLFSHLANVGDAKSLVIHPASTTHSRMDNAALLQAGISQGLVRLSIGLEDASDLISDLSKALYRSQK
jgi:O-acetylhomoserine (thiol)-lyase